MRKVKTGLLLLGILAGVRGSDCVAQSLTGTSGLVTIPSAELPKDGEVIFGLNAGNKKYNVRNPGKFHHYSYYATIGYLPFLEVSLRLTRHTNFSWSFGDEGLGDRMASVRLRVMKEKKYTPSLVLGVHDVFSAFEKTKVVYFNALYIVGSKTIKPMNSPFRFGLHMGYGTDRMKAKHHEFVGLFGGLSIGYKDFLSFMVEQDTEKFNGGVRLDLFRHVQILAALLNFDSFSGGVSFRFAL
jgi:hypothetical protein